MERKAGTVKLFKGHWGFITQDTGGDIFFSHGDADRPPKPGERVTYEIVKGTRGNRAVKIQICEVTAENWHCFLDLAPFPGFKLREDEAATRKEQVTAALKGSRGLRV